MFDGLNWGVLWGALVQTGLVLLWIGRSSARIDMMERKLNSQDGVNERLARLEEQALAQRAALERIEVRLSFGKWGDIDD